MPWHFSSKIFSPKFFFFFFWQDKFAPLMFQASTWTKKLNVWALFSTKLEQKIFQFHTMIAWRSPQAKMSIHLKGLHCSFFQFCSWNLKLFKWIFVCVNFQGLFCSKLNQTKFASKLLPYLLQNNSVTTTWYNTVLIIPKFSVTGRLNLLEEFSKQVTNFTSPAIKI